LRRGVNLVEVCLRSEETDFQVNHFRAVCRFAEANSARSAPILPTRPSADVVSLDPDNDLYGRILFHRGRFCRLTNYRLLTAWKCIAEISADNGAVWFGPYLPASFVLGDPGARDAALHSIQACIPHRRLLPTGLDHLAIYRLEKGSRLVRAKERQRE